MDAEQLWETTLNPETRMMKRIEIEDARMASGVTEMLMGTEVPPRRAFIYENATEAELDISNQIGKAWIFKRGKSVYQKT